MGLAILRSRALEGLSAPEVTVEVHLAAGLPAFTLVGLPDTEVRESRDRVRAALHNCGFEFPQRRITVNLAPADLPKESGRFDLPIALGILVASGQIDAPALDDHEFAGELALSGELRAVRLKVSDNGPGFAEKVQKRAFEPYVTTKPKGTGLGLAVVRKIADEHGARVRIANLLPPGQTEGTPCGAQVSLSFSRFAAADPVREHDSTGPASTGVAQRT